MTHSVAVAVKADGGIGGGANVLVLAGDGLSLDGAAGWLGEGVGVSVGTPVDVGVRLGAVVGVGE
jgi:hypothetical protein